MRRAWASRPGACRYPRSPWTANPGRRPGPEGIRRSRPSSRSRSPRTAGARARRRARARHGCAPAAVRAAGQTTAASHRRGGPRARSRDGKHEHGHRPGSRDDAARIVQEQRAVQVGQPALDRVRVGRGHARPRRRIDHGRPRRSVVEPVCGDASGGRALDLLHPRIGDLDAGREIGNAHRVIGLRRAPAAPPPGRPKGRPR